MYFVKKGKIYLLLDWGSSPNEKYKIGITKNEISKRIKQLTTGSSSELVLINSYESENYKQIEGVLHRRYKTYSTCGGKEWFELPNDKVIDFKKHCEEIDKNIKFLNENNSFLNSKEFKRI